MISIELIQSIEQLSQLNRDWEDVLKSSGSNYPFLTLEWLLPWWKHMTSKGTTLFVLRASQAGETCGYAPLCLDRRGGTRILKFIGCPDSDYLDFIVCKNREETLKAFLEYLFEQRRMWDLIDLRDIPSDSPNFTFLSALERNAHDLRLAIHERTIAPTLRIDGDFQSFCDNKSTHFRRSIKGMLKKLTRSDTPLLIRMIGLNDNWEDILETMNSIEEESWKEKKGLRRLSSLNSRRFFSEFMNNFANRGWLNLWCLSIDRKDVAFQLNFYYNNKIYLYYIVHDDRYRQSSPGTLLLTYEIEKAFNERLAEFDFGSGDETYKDRWSNDKRVCHQIVFYRGSPRSMVLFVLLRKLRWVLKRSNTVLRLKIWLVVKQRKIGEAMRGLIGRGPAS